MSKLGLALALLGFTYTAVAADFSLPDESAARIVRSGERFSVRPLEALAHGEWSLVFVSGYPLAKRDIYKGLYQGDLNRDALLALANRTLVESNQRERLRLVFLEVARNSTMVLSARSGMPISPPASSRSSACGAFYMECADAYIYLHSEKVDYSDTREWLLEIGVGESMPDLPAVALIDPEGAIEKLWYASGTGDNAMPPIDLLVNDVMRRSDIRAETADMPEYRQKLVQTYGIPGYETQWTTPNAVLTHQKSIGILAPLVKKD